MESNRYIADENDDHHYAPRDDRRGPQRRRRDDAPRQPRGGGYVEPPPARLRRMLVNIASSTKLPEDEAIEIAEILRDNYDDEEARNEFFDVLVLLWVALPFPFCVSANLLQCGRTAFQDSIRCGSGVLREPDQGRHHRRSDEACRRSFAEGSRGRAVERVQAAATLPCLFAATFRRGRHLRVFGPAI